MDDRGVMGELSQLRIAVEALAGSSPNPVMAVNYTEAARILGFESSKTISRMVGSGQIVAVKLGRTWMIPMMELRRITTPKADVRRGRPSSRVNNPSTRASVEALLKRKG